MSRLRLTPQKPTETKEWGEWWWYEDKDGIRVCHWEKGRNTALAFFSWRKIKGALKRLESKGE